MSNARLEGTVLLRGQLMAGPPAVLGSPPIPTQKSFATQQPATSINTVMTARPSFDQRERDGPAVVTGRNAPASAMPHGPRTATLGPSPMPGSFSSDIRSQLNLSRAGSRLDMYAATMEKVDEKREDPVAVKEQTISQLREQLSREMKIKEGSENMLEALNSKKAKQVKDQRARVEAELNASNHRIKELRQKITDAQQIRPLPAPITPTRERGSGIGGAGKDLGTGSVGGLLLRSPPSASRSGAGAASDHDEPTESPTFALAEILQALEVDGMTADYYVSRANNLVDLFRRYPTLKYDLVWSIFGLRMQAMLLSQSREVVAAAYRMIRYAISDVTSLRKIRALNTDYLVAWSLTKDRKSDVEREQALKFVRAFLDVKDGVHEISMFVVRTIVSVAEEPEERLRPICIETLAEILVRDPKLLIVSGGVPSLHEAMSDGSYKASDSLAAVFLYLLDSPDRRQYLQAGYELECLCAAFTDDLTSTERILKQSSKAVATAFKSWSGLMNLSMYSLRAIKSLVHSMMIQQGGGICEAVIDLIYALLRIKSPTWATSFLAGRRLTTYGRVANLRGSTATKASHAVFDDDGGEQNFVQHYTALLLAVFVKSGVVPALLKLVQSTDSAPLKRKATLLVGEVLKLSSRLLPSSWSSQLQLLPELFCSAARLEDEGHFSATGIVYQISSVSRTLYRSSPPAYTPSALPPGSSSMDLGMTDEPPNKGNPAGHVDDATFRQLIVESNVLNSANWTKWDWDVIIRIIEGPLISGKRLEEAIRASKFIKRIMSFYRPFKGRFSKIRASRNSQKYVRAGCSLMYAMLQSVEGSRYLSDSKLLRQIAECLAQCDPTSGLTAEIPVFSLDRLESTLCSGYFPMLGVLSGDARGIQMLDRWRIFNMMYHIVDLKQRPDLVKLVLVHFDYSIQGHPRVLLSKALGSGAKDIRIYATNVLRKYTTRPSVTSVMAFGVVGQIQGPARNQSQSLSLGPGQNHDSIRDATNRWAIQLLVTQLYDPEIEVCSTAIKILEKACNTKNHLEYIVECRPALDHLGEIGAPLLLRFLSTSIGYHYLDGLDYISNEMDDWFLGRNDAYVGVIEASLARSFLDTQHQLLYDQHSDDQSAATAAAHAGTTMMMNRIMSVFGHSTSSLFGNDPSTVPGDPDDSLHNVPPHFYRELTRTKEGCRLLRDKGHFDEFAATIRDYGMYSDDPEMLLKVKGCMWAVGAVGSMELGAPFLESCDVVQRIVAIAQEHEVLSVRGTAFFVLGLISRSVHGLEMLSEHGWDANTNALGQSLGFCLPTDLNKFLSLKPWKHNPVTSIKLPDTQQTCRGVKLPALLGKRRSVEWVNGAGEQQQPVKDESKEGLQQQQQQQQQQQEKGSLAHSDPIHHRILELVNDLTNLVLYKKARIELMQMRAQNRNASGFHQPRLFRQVMALLERHRYRLADRNLVVGLFDRNVLRSIVYDEDEDEKGGEAVPDKARQENQDSSDDEMTDYDGGEREDSDEEQDRRESSGGEQAEDLAVYDRRLARKTVYFPPGTAPLITAGPAQRERATTAPEGAARNSMLRDAANNHSGGNGRENGDEDHGDRFEDRDDEDGGFRHEPEDNSSDEEQRRAERQRSVSDPADIWGRR